MTRLGDVATYINGYAFKPTDWSNKGMPIIRIQDLTGNSYQANRFNGTIDKKYIIRDGDVLISWSASLGVYVWRGETALLNQHIFKVVFDKVDVDKNFFIHQVKAILEKASSAAHGATMKHLTKPVFDALLFCLPSIEEQKGIAKKLDKVCALIEQRKQQIEKLDQLVKSRFIELFGDPVACKNKRKLSEIGKIFTGNTPPMKEPSYYESNDIPFIKPSDLSESGVTNIDSAEAYVSEKARPVARMIPPNAVLVTCIGTIGKIGITARESCCNQQINFVVPNSGINSVYLAHCLTFFKSTLQSIANAPVVPIINKSQFSELEISVFDMDKQKQFATFVEQTDKSKLAIQQSLEKLETLKKALMQQYFE